ncbi:hypothetical protein MM236_19190 [Belliella sp. DSM 107340]|uniref:Uncharacterized protein n=1 Tax=Belliella calami TaxID=2923436 RepID=A0ABS9UUE4_9BACT|nr:hypothetical protein [Belliella calami]MCH7400129.1 hypothetical protein [Belliella calami]
MSGFGIVKFDDLFPVKESPKVGDKVFGYDAQGNINAAFRIQAILDLLESSNPDWSDIQNKPNLFPPTAHTLGSHSNVASNADTATDGQILRRMAGAWAPFTADYLTSFTESDPTVPAWVKAILQNQIANWDQAHGWGNHAGQYRPVDWVPTWAQVSGKPNAFTPTAHTLGSHSNVDTNADTATDGQILRREGGSWKPWTPDFIEEFQETDPTVPVHVKNISVGDLSNWNNASNILSEVEPNHLPHVQSGLAKTGKLKAILSEIDEEDENSVQEVIAYEFTAPVKGQEAQEDDEYVTKSQINDSVNYTEDNKSEPEKVQARDNIDVFSRQEVKDITGLREDLVTAGKENLVVAINQAASWDLIEW